MGISAYSCMDCGIYPEEQKFEIKSRPKTIESQYSDITHRYLKDCEIEEIRLDCMQKSQLLERRNQAEMIKEALESNRCGKVSVTELVDMAERAVNDKTHDRPYTTE